MTKQTTNKLGRRGGATIAGALVAALTLASAGEAHADTSYFEPEVAGNSWVIGNSEFNAQATIIGQQQAEGYISDGLRAYETMSQDVFATFAKVFGKSGQLLSTVARGDGSSRSGKYAESSGKVNVMGSVIWTGDGSDTSACPSNDVAAVSCASYNRDWSKTFYSIDKDFPVSIFTVNVKANVKGGVRAHLSTQTTTMQGLPANKKHHLGLVHNSVGSGAYATAFMSASVSVISPSVAGVGVDGTFTLIDVMATSKTSTMHRNDTVVKSFMVDWDFGFTVKTMNGKVDVWAQVSPFWKPTRRLIDIAGYSKYIPVEDSTSTTVLPSLDP